MSDEARHVAFGVLSLKEYYEGLSDAEMLERQEFAFEASYGCATASSSKRLGAHGRAGQGRRRSRHEHAVAAAVPDDALLQDRADCKETRSARPQTTAGCVAATRSSASFSSRI